MVPEIKIGIADDHKIFRKGVILSMRQYTNLRFVLEAENGEELLAMIPDAMPEIILCDLKMPIKDGIDATKAITKMFPTIRVIILTMYEDDRFVGHRFEKFNVNLRYKYLLTFYGSRNKNWNCRRS